MAQLAIKGGTPYRTKEFPGWTMITPADARGLQQVYDQSEWGIDGPKNKEFQEKFAAYSGTKHCITVANGTVSIELILRGLGIGRGDEVIVPPYTFIASISSLIYAGVTPVFADIDKETFQMSAQSAEQCITPRTKAIMPVYVGGCPADLDAFEALCKQYGLYLIGDAAQAVGSTFHGKGIASYAVATSISCQNSKNLTCGEGGIILTDNDELYERIDRMLHGGRDDDGNYIDLGLYNGMSEFQASILLTQLEHLPAQIEKRMKNAAYLDEQLAKLPCVYPMKQDERITCNSYHLYLLGIREDQLHGVSRDDFLAAVQAEGVPLVAGYVPAYSFDCLASDYTKKCIGGQINLTPHTPNAETVGYHEGAWIYHAVLLGEQSDMDDIVGAITKVYQNLDELK